VKQGNALDWTVRNRILKQTFHELNSAPDPSIPKQLAPFFPLPQATSGEEFSDLVVRIAVGAGCPTGASAFNQIPGEMVCDDLSHLFMQPTEACHAAHRMSAKAPR
jgi:hypothetical protein